MSFRRVAWDAHATRHVATIADLTASQAAGLCDDHASGRRQVTAVELDGRRVASIVWSVQDDADGRALVIDAMAADRLPRGVDLIRDAQAWAHDLARRIDAGCIRLWTVRPGVVRRLSSWSRRYVMEVPTHGR